MNDPMIDFINSMYDQKITELNAQIQSEIDKHAYQPTFNIAFQELNILYVKKAEFINSERHKFISIWNSHMHNQDMINFMSIGHQMNEIKKMNRKSYDHIVDKAFAVDSPLSLYKFKYASK